MEQHEQPVVDPPAGEFRSQWASPGVTQQQIVVQPRRRVRQAAGESTSINADSVNDARYVSALSATSSTRLQLESDENGAIGISSPENDRPSTPATEVCSCSSDAPDRERLPSLDAQHVADEPAGLRLSHSASAHAAPQQIDVEELLGEPEYQGSHHRDSIHPAVADALRGQGLPGPGSIQKNPDFQSDPTVITDLGDRLAPATSQDPDDGLETERPPSLLHQALETAKVRCEDSSYEHRSFIPRALLARTMTREAVLEELRSSYMALLKESLKKQLRRQFPSLLPPHLARHGLDLADDARRICGNGKSSFQSGEHHDSDGAATAQSPRSPTVAGYNMLQLPEAQQKSFKKIMAILILMEKPKKIRRFLDEGISDTDLPLKLAKVPRDGGSSKIPGSRWELRSTRAKDQDKTLRCFRRWKPRAMEEFERLQWAVLAPFFALGGVRRVTISGGGRYRDLRTIYHWELNSGVILPFISFSTAGPPGGCGQVFKAKIHPDHHAFNLNYEAHRDVIAVKQLFSDKEADFKREVRMLRRLNSANPHPHLTNLLGTYKYHGQYHLMFPWADCDLVGFWSKARPNPKTDDDTAGWLIHQCRGLADALGSIHRYPTNTDDSILRHDSESSARDPQQPNPGIKMLYGRHGDIKPANILWFPKDPHDPKPQDPLGILKLSDFGIAEFSSQTSVPTSRGMIPNTRPYCAPEILVCCDPEATVHSMNDIWSLGCVYLECVAWYYGGWKEVESFLERRSTPDDDNPSFKIPSFYATERDPKTRKPTGVCVKAEVVQVCDQCMTS